MIRLLDFPNYMISNNGEIFGKGGKPLATHPNKNVKYLQATLWKDNKGTKFYVHRLVAQCYVPNPSNLPEVNHKDGNKLNNCHTNLEWTDSKGNSVHAVNTGLRTYSNRLTKDQFVECLNLIINGMSYQELSGLVPYKVPYLSTKLRKLAKELNKEHLLNDSLSKQQIIRANKNLEKINK